MALISSETRLCDVVNRDPSIIPVINRFGIRLGTGDLTMEEIAAAHNVDCGFLLAILNTFVYDEYFPEDKLLSFRAGEIIDYLSKTDTYYRDYQLPNIGRHFKLLLATASDNVSLEALFNFFRELERDINLRIDRDLQQWFPSLTEIADGGDGSAVLDTPQPGDTSIEDKLADLKNMFIKHLTGAYDLNLCYAVVSALSSLEKDIRQNNRIRDRILVPVSLRLQHKA